MFLARRTTTGNRAADIADCPDRFEYTILGVGFGSMAVGLLVVMSVDSAIVTDVTATALASMLLVLTPVMIIHARRRASPTRRRRMT